MYGTITASVYDMVVQQSLWCSIARTLVVLYSFDHLWFYFKLVSLCEALISFTVNTFVRAQYTTCKTVTVLCDVLFSGWIPQCGYSFLSKGRHHNVSSDPERSLPVCSLISAITGSTVVTITRRACRIVFFLGVEGGCLFRLVISFSCTNYCIVLQSSYCALCTHTVMCFITF